MRHTLQELLAVAVTVTVLVGMPFAVFRNGPWTSDGHNRIIHLTGVMKGGVWTDERVNGLNYWWKSFPPAEITIDQGEEVLLRLSSSDVTHSFYVPELGLGPITVKPGHTEEVLFRAEREGRFVYHCITVCGECHYFMKGAVVVLSTDVQARPGEHKTNPECELHDSPGTFPSYVEKGKYLYSSRGCGTCHGSEGKGGIYNPNYVSQFVPRLDDIADKMKIYWEEDAHTVIKLLESGSDLESLEDDPPIDNFSRFIAQYRSIHTKINEGSPKVQRLDRRGPDPPLSMPAWREQLSEEDINSILAYLITLFPWEDFE